MTATESSYRMSIRGKSISGLLTQEKSEAIEPTCHRAISVILDCGLFGKTYDEVMNLPEITEEQIAYKQRLLNEGDFIPQIVSDAMKDNKIWYKLKYNGELEKLLNAEVYEAIGRFLQYLNAVLQIKPELIHAINAYEFLDLLKSVSNLVNDNLIKNKYEYEELLAKMQEEAAAQAEQQAMLNQSQVAKNLASAGKDSAIANAN
jgi:hypothetical protein